MGKLIKMLPFVLMVAIWGMLFAGCEGDKTESAVKTEVNTNDKVPPVKLVNKTYHAPRDGYEDFSSTNVGQIIMEKLNVNLQILPTKAESTDQSLITDIATNSLADIITVWSSPSDTTQLNIITKAAKEDILADLSSEIKNFPILNKAVKKENLPLFTQEVLYDSAYNNKLYFLPTGHSVVSPWLSGWGLYIRDDIAKAVGVKTPDTSIKTTDDLYNLLKKIKAGNFKDTNGKDIYPIGNIAQWSQILAALTRPFDFGGSAQIGILNGKVTGFVQTDYAWNQILWVRKLLKEGLLDPEAMTQSYDIGAEKMAQGRYAVSAMFKYMPTLGSDYAKTLISAHPEMAYKPLGNMNNYKGDDTVTINKGMEAHQLIAFRKGSDIKSALKLIEWASSKEGKPIGAFGKEGEGWFKNDKGFAQEKPGTLKEDASDAEKKAYALKIGGGGLDLLQLAAGADNVEQNPFGGDGRNTNYQTNSKLDDEMAVNVKGTMPKIKVINKLNLDYLLLKYPNRDKIEPIIKQQHDLMIQCYLVKTEEEAKKIYNGYLETLKKNGYNEYLDYIQQEFNKNPDRYAEYVTEVQ